MRERSDHTIDLLYTETVVYPSFEYCGTYGESPAGVPVEFNREYYQHTIYDEDGKIVRRWDDYKDFFVKCLPP